MGVLLSLFSIVAYGYFFWALPLQATAFMINLRDLVPAVKPFFLFSIDSNPYFAVDGSLNKFLLDVVLAGLFAIPHSIFARPAVKKLFNAGNAYRPFYVFKSALCLHILMYFWQPISDKVLWNAPPKVALGIYFLGWFWLVTSTFAIDHFELFGLKQGLGVDIYGKLGFGVGDGLVERLHYKLVRHPIMLGFFVMFFVVPTMTATHLFFSTACTAYILLAVAFLEEPDLVSALGNSYKDYQKRVPMYCPFTGGKTASAKKQEPPKSDAAKGAATNGSDTNAAKKAESPGARKRASTPEGRRVSED